MGSGSPAIDPSFRTTARHPAELFLNLSDLSPQRRGIDYDNEVARLYIGVPVADLTGIIINTPYRLLRTNSNGQPKNAWARSSASDCGVTGRFPLTSSSNTKQ
jgi:hypothetical protein